VVGWCSTRARLRRPRRYARAASLVALSAEHGLAVAHLPLHHSDPFDRLLVAQAALDGLTL
jgi:PIN domain nuclease of toxin-antitoxin system